MIKTNSMDKEIDDDRKIVEVAVKKIFKINLEIFQETGKEDELVEDLGEAYPEVNIAKTHRILPLLSYK